MRPISRRYTGKPPSPRGPQVPALLTVESAAEFFGVNERWIRLRIARRLLPARRFGGRIVFLRNELEQFLADLPGISAIEAKRNLDLRNGDEGQR